MKLFSPISVSPYTKSNATVWPSFPLVKVMGSFILPIAEIVRQLVLETEQSDQCQQGQACHG